MARNAGGTEVTRHMKDYTSIDTSQLTIEDALADELFNRTPFDYFEYIAIGADVIEGLPDFTVEEAGEVFKAVANYCITGQYPEYGEMGTTAVKVTVRGLIHAHEKRMNSEYLRHYRQFVSTQAKKQAKEKQ